MWVFNAQEIKNDVCLPFHLISGVKQRAMRKPSRTKPVIKEGSIGRSFNDPVWRAAITHASNEPRLHRGANNAH
ncbi:hypothetical protein CEXT_476121 [Caerostris extrusa]|uniref:Uncharacterized protein n=1 Tax=Caerostris extrusa TaxID=172846 RepID=A0AAV4N5N0_CAEEX|nr:hypothetical protein CEXT_476121 [Caerostris extrusa]